MRRFRLIIDEGPAHYQMAMDEALLLLRGMGVIEDTLRLYVMKPSSVTIGYFQSLSESVNLEYVRSKGIPIVRRISGGGSVYHDSSGEITYSVVVAEDSLPTDYVESFKYFINALITAAGILGCEAEFKPLNDVVINDRKVSGSAQARKLGAVLQHGTFMYDTDIDTLAKCLSVPRGKYGAVSSPEVIKARVTTITLCRGSRVRRDEALKALIEGFRKALNAELRPSKYLREELELCRSLEWKYRSSEWLRIRP